MMLKAFDAIATLSGRTSVEPYPHSGYALGMRRSKESGVPRQVDSGARSELPAAKESVDVGDMTDAPALPTDIAALHALIAAERAAHTAVAIERDTVMRERDLLAARANAPIATEALARIKLLYDIEAEIRGLPPELRRRLRQDQSKPLVEALKPWFVESLAKVPKGGKVAEALGYGLNHWDGLCRYLDDGRIEIDSNTVERSIRGLALTRKNALFAGHDRGAEGWATCASLIETCKLNNVDPLAWMTDVLTKLVNRWPNSRIDELMPWAYAKNAA